MEREKTFGLETQSETPGIVREENHMNESFRYKNSHVGLKKKKKKFCEVWVGQCMIIMNK